MPGNPFREKEERRATAEANKRKEQRDISLLALLQEQARKADEDRRNKADREKIERDTWRRQIAAAKGLNWLTGAAALFATVSAFGIIWSVCESRVQMRIDQRAWIEIQPITPVLKAPRSRGFGALYTYSIFPKNVGKTAAYDIAFKAIRSAPMSSLSLGDNAVDIANYQRQLETNAMKMPAILVSRRVSKTLGPGEVSNAPFDIHGQEPQWGSIYQFLIGRVDYVDAFGVPHWRTFCLFIADSNGGLQYCQYGNDVDHKNQ